jgi:hypothetical protein
MNGVDLEAAAMEAAVILGEHPGRVVSKYRAVKAAKGRSGKAKELARQGVRSLVELEKDSARIIARGGGWNKTADYLRKNPGLSRKSRIVEDAQALVVSAYRNAEKIQRMYGIPVSENAALAHAVSLLDRAQSLPE